MKTRKGMTIVEASIMIAISAVVGGLILDTFIVTNRSSNQLVEEQQLQQEALLIAQSVEKVIRRRFPAEARSAAAGGGVTTNTLPASVQSAMTSEPIAALMATPTDSQTTPAARDAMTSPPPSVKGLLTTPTEVQPGATPASVAPPEDGEATAPATNGSEAFLPSELRVQSLAFADSIERALTTIASGKTQEGLDRVSITLGQQDGGTTGSYVLFPGTGKALKSAVSFRYATGYNGLAASWSEQAVQTPRVIEYTVRVWPARFESFETAALPGGQKLGYQYVSGLRLP